MAETSARRAQKRALIVTSARTVFQREGFLNVTMKDIIEAAGISRGGVYLYFHSVAEVFVAVLTERNRHTLEDVQARIAAGTSYQDLLAWYLAEQKQRLLTLDSGSLLQAAYEYYFTHQSPADRAFLQRQFAVTEETVTAILQQGVASGAVAPAALVPRAQQVMVVIEGLSVLALTAGVTAQQVDTQLGMIAGA